MIGPFTVSRRGISAPIGRDYNLLIQQLIHEILVVLDDPGDFPMFLSAATGLESERAAAIDPALDFLLPPMSADPQEAARLRALTEDTLRSQKLAGCSHRHAPCFGRRTRDSRRFGPDPD